MRGRKPPKVKVPRARREKIDTTGKERIRVPWCPRVGIVLVAGPEQSLVRWVDVEDGDHLPAEAIYPNTWLNGKQRVIRVKPDERVQPKKAERVAIKGKAEPRVMPTPTKAVKRSWSLAKFSDVVTARAKKRGVDLDTSLLEAAYKSGCSVADAVHQCKM